MRGTASPGTRGQAATPTPAAVHLDAVDPATIPDGGTAASAAVPGRAPERQRPTLDRLRARRRDRERALVGEAVLGERQRIAADLHDLVMQDLALALANARMLAAAPGAPEEADVVVAAGERALAEARKIVGGLLAEARTPVREAVGSSAALAARSVPLHFSSAGVPADAEPDESTCDTLVHIAREAVTNAVKHAAPRALEVELEYGEEWRLRVSDDGAGFDAGKIERGFGLDSMEAQAHALGGALHIVSSPGGGTTIEAVLP